jgi:hypothetical protein
MAVILEAAVVITNLTGFVSGLLSLFCYLNKQNYLPLPIEATCSETFEQEELERLDIPSHAIPVNLITCLLMSFV